MKRYLDFETTGLNRGLKLDQLVSVGIVDESGEVLLNTHALPTVEIDTEAIETHGIDVQTLLQENAAPIGEVVPQIVDLLRGHQVWIYNAAYDLRILHNTATASGLFLPGLDYRCAMERYSEAWKQPNSHGYKAQKLTAALEQQGLPLLPAHDAVTDCQMMLQLMNHLDSGKVNCYTDGANFDVEFVKIARRVASNRKPYPRFETIGGQTVNVFDNSYHLLRGKGYPVDGWLSKLAEQPDDYTQPLSKSINAVIRFSGEYINLQSISSEWQATA